MQALMVRFTSGLSGEQGEQVKANRRAVFQEVPGLLQAYFLRVSDRDGAVDTEGDARGRGNGEADGAEFGAFFLFDSAKSLEAFLGSDVVKRTPEEMEVLGDIERHTFEVTEPLYEKG